MRDDNDRKKKGKNIVFLFSAKEFFKCTEAYGCRMGLVCIGEACNGCEMDSVRAGWDQVGKNKKSIFCFLINSRE